ncbi:hypothetical protein [Palleniella muris]|uniref:hypothetical protein n=1 Tax=Palleniella muris TaxID=3038145 RepID=UPI001441219D|nr:hypothetical protein [Palleniella muris]
MALPIKAIPTLYGEEARRFRLRAEAAERRYKERGGYDATKGPRYIMMREILRKAKM